jgi:hypothetical protein
LICTLPCILIQLVAKFLAKPSIFLLCVLEIMFNVFQCLMIECWG